MTTVIESWFNFSGKKGQKRRMKALNPHLIPRVKVLFSAVPEIIPRKPPGPLG